MSIGARSAGLLILCASFVACPASNDSSTNSETSADVSADAGSVTDLPQRLDQPPSPPDAEGAPDRSVDANSGGIPAYALPAACPRETSPGGEEWSGWANLQFPEVQELETGQLSEPIYGQVWQEGVTDQPGRAEGWEAQLVVGPLGAHPERQPGCFRALDAAFNVDSGNNDEYFARVSSDRAGLFGMFYRYRPPGGAWRYGDLNGSDDGATRDQAAVLAVDDPAGPPEIRVLSLNLRCRTDDWATRFDLVVEALAALDPHVVGFQEDCATIGGEPQSHEVLEVLADRLDRGYQVVRRDTHRANYPEGEFDEGVSLMTALPIDGSDHVDLPYETFPRVALVVDVRVGAGSLLRVANTHFDFGASASEERAEAAGLIVDQMEAGKPMIVTGDFNATPVSDAYSVLAEAFDDAWLTANPGTDGYTIPSIAPERRIDYIFTSGVAVESARLVDGESGGVHLSDHLGVAGVFIR